MNDAVMEPVPVSTQADEGGSEQSIEQSPARDRLGRLRHRGQFQPGVSGNPSGRRGRPKPAQHPPTTTSAERVEKELADRIWAWVGSDGWGRDGASAHLGVRLAELLGRHDPAVAGILRNRLRATFTDVLTVVGPRA